MSDTKADDRICVDPQMQPLLDAMRERMASRVPMRDLSPVDIRARASSDLAIWNVDPPVLANVETFEIPGPFGKTAVRLYDPVGGENLEPGLVYFHGGGWLIGDLETEDRSIRQLALAANVRIVSVQYCLAPEHKFPEPVEDCVSAAQWIHGHAEELGLDPQRLAIGGASAGANLALATVLALRDKGYDFFRFMLFFYGVFGEDLLSESYDRFGTGDYGLDRDSMAYFYELYLRDSSQRKDPLVAPVRADLSGLPSAFLSVAGLDPLRDDSHQLADRLVEAGVPVKVIEYPGVVHGFSLMGLHLDAANKTLHDAGRALADALTGKLGN